MRPVIALVLINALATACGAARFDEHADATADAGVAVDAEPAPKDAAPPEASVPSPDAEPAQDALPAKDAATPDAGVVLDSGVALDAGAADAGTADSGPPDAAAPDAAIPDAATPDAGTPDAGPPDTGPVFGALYPSAPGWNDYVAADGPDRLSATGTACDPITDGPGYDGCIHSGEKRVFEVPGQSSCAGLTISDALGLFDWVCDPRTNPVRVISEGLTDEGPLSALLDWSASPVAWRPNSVRVMAAGNPVLVSPPEVWWPNPIVEQAQGGTLDTAGAIYAVTTSITASFTISAGSVALVARPGALITSEATAPVVVAQRQDFLWIEGAMATGWTVGVQLGQVQLSVLRDLRVDGARTSGVWLSGGSDSNRLQRITVSGARTSAFAAGLTLTGSDANGVYDLLATDNRSGLILDGARNNGLHKVVVRGSISHGVWLRNGASDNQLTEVRASRQRGAGHGLFIDGTAHRTWLQDVVSVSNGGDGIMVVTNDNTFADVITANNGRYGVEVALGAGNNRFVGLAAAGNAFRGVRLDGADNNVLIAVTVLNTAGSGGLELDDASGNTVSSAAVVNAAAGGSAGVLVRGNAGTPSAVDNQFADLASAHNGTFGITLDEAHDGRFTGLLILGGHGGTDCEISGGSNPGLRLEGIVQGDENCTADGASDATVERDTDLSAAFVAKVDSDDGTNPDDTDGGARFNDITDWVTFDHALRAWATDDVAAFPAVAHRGPCTVNSDCRIWDLALRSADATLRQRAAVPEGDDVLEHRWRAADAAACAAIAGATWDGATCASTFLRGAFERVGDGEGNENGLCESQETCVYAPNLGAYQGHGDFASAATFVDGTITGVSLIRFIDNGR